VHIPIDLFRQHGIGLETVGFELAGKSSKQSEVQEGIHNTIENQSVLQGHQPRKFSGWAVVLASRE
jgi:hypothetical protein